MGFVAGDNTVRVLRFKKEPHGIYVAYKFQLVNLRNETHNFSYAVPFGSLAPPRLIRDLQELKRLDLWFTAYLQEKWKLLAIRSIKEPRQCQEELWALFKSGRMVTLN